MANTAQPSTPQQVVERMAQDPKAMAAAIVDLQQTVTPKKTPTTQPGGAGSESDPPSAQSRPATHHLDGCTTCAPILQSARESVAEDLSKAAHWGGMDAEVETLDRVFHEWDKAGRPLTGHGDALQTLGIGAEA